ARERPVDVVLEPFAEAAVLDVLGVPADRLVAGEQLVLVARGGDVPARLGVVEERRRAAPAVRIGVLVDLLAEGAAGAVETRPRRSSSAISPSVVAWSLTKRPSKPTTRSSNLPSRPTGL